LAGLLTTRALLFFGFISYPFYLMHENLLIAIVRKIGTTARPLPDFLIPAVPVAIIAALSYLLAKHLEPAVKRLIQACIARLRLGAAALLRL
jgi:peptidoglycan/LPS O-acetylase OafA/YrhL